MFWDILLLVVINVLGYIYICWDGGIFGVFYKKVSKIPISAFGPSSFFGLWPLVLPVLFSAGCFRGFLVVGREWGTLLAELGDGVVRMPVESRGRGLRLRCTLRKPLPDRLLAAAVPHLAFFCKSSNTGKAAVSS